MNAIYDALDHIHRHSDLEWRIKCKILVCLASHLTVGCHRITPSRMGRSRSPRWTPNNPTNPRLGILIFISKNNGLRIRAELARSKNTPPRARQEFGRGDARRDQSSFAPRPKSDNRAGDMLKLGTLRSSGATGLGPQMNRFNSHLSRKGDGSWRALKPEESSQSSRSTAGVATTPSIESTNTFEYVFCDFADCSIFRDESEGKDDDPISPPARPQEVSVMDSDDDDIAEGGY